MSDDGYGAYSPYDSDFDDFLYDADPAPDLADDLASHAIHSPLFQDEPGYELAEYHSDWDYYSDDYYDDDPDILKHNPQDGSPIKSRSHNKAEGLKRGKKRKLVDVQDIPDIDLGERKTLKDCMRGTVWATPLPERDNVFVRGDDEKIALLKDWKNVFGTTSVQDKAISTQPPDESWANDMSLADMGLRNERGNMVEQGGEKDVAELEDEDGEGMELDEEGAAALLEQIEGMDEEEAAALLQRVKGQAQVNAPAASPDTSPAKKLHPLATVQASSSPSLNQLNEPLPVLSKRRKQNNDVLPSPPQSNQSPVLEHSDAAAPTPVADEEKGLTQEPKRGRGRPTKSSNANATPRATSSSTVNSRGTRKRKASASPSPERTKGVSRTTASSRAKRVASSVKGVGTETSEKESSRMNVSTRSSRSRKKL